MLQLQNPCNKTVVGVVPLSVILHEQVRMAKVTAMVTVKRKGKGTTTSTVHNPQ